MDSFHGANKVRVTSNFNSAKTNDSKVQTVRVCAQLFLLWGFAYPEQNNYTERRSGKEYSLAVIHFSFRI